MFEKAYEEEFKPAEEQVTIQEKHFGCIRFIPTQMLASVVEL